MTEAKRVHKVLLPDDGEWHRLDIPPVVAVGESRHARHSIAETALWFEAREGWAPVAREYRTFPTGADIPLDAQHVGTYASAEYTGVVVHVYAREIQ